MMDYSKLPFRALALSLLPAASFAVPYSGDMPNVIVIMTDQQSYNMLSCNDNEWISTPGVDHLAETGYNFVNTYCSNPVSMPSRFSLFTGTYASTVGTRGNNSQYVESQVADVCEYQALGVMFQNAGYNTYYAGKTHLYTGEEEQYGYSVWGENGYDDPEELANSIFPARSSKPVLAVFSFMNPHDISYEAGLDPRYNNSLSTSKEAATAAVLAYKETLTEEEYQAQIPPRPENLNVIDELGADYTSTGSGYRTWDDDEWDLYRWMYHRLSESVDAQIANVLDLLEENGYDETNTIIVFTSDHGEFNQAHQLVHKTYMLEEAQRVPFIFWGKGIQNIKDYETLTCNGLDMTPTLCDLAGVARPDDMLGISWANVLTGSDEEQETRDYLITEASVGYQILDGDYKLSVYENSGSPKTLFNYVDDIGETNNLIYDEEYEAIKEYMLDKLVTDLSARGVSISYYDGATEGLLFEDNFDYDVEAGRALVEGAVASTENVDAVTGWHTFNNTSSAINSFEFVDESLEYLDYETASAGKAIKYLGDEGQGVFYDLSTTLYEDVTFHVSYLINVSADVATNGEDYITGIKMASSGSSNNFGCRVFLKVDPTNVGKEVSFGINKTSHDDDFVLFTEEGYAAGETHLVVIEYKMGDLLGESSTEEAGCYDDIMSLYIDPVIADGADGNEPVLVYSDAIQKDMYRWGSSKEFGGAYSFYMRSAETDESPVYTIDGIRVGYAWSDLLPIDQAEADKIAIAEAAANVAAHVSNGVIAFSGDLSPYSDYGVLNLNGQIVAANQFLNGQIDASGLLPGAYIVRLYGDVTTNIRVVIE